MNILLQLTSFMCYFMFICPQHKAQLVVNVKDKGGDIIQETIEANTTQDTVSLHFKKFDGTLISQFIDFKNEIQIFKSIVLAENERGQHGYQVMCFVVRFVRNEFVSSDAMSKLRQKNPGAIRHPEEVKTKEVLEMDALLDLEQASVISPYIPIECKDARDTTYVRENDLSVLAKALNKDYAVLLGAAKRTPTYKYQTCRDLDQLWKPCICSYEACVGWYPCGLKYCKGKDSTGKVVSYRCGIKTCSKCRMFQYYARQKSQCLWDELEWSEDQLNNRTKSNINSDKLGQKIIEENNIPFK